MLVVSRKAGESILLDGGIEIHVVKVMGSKIRLGITAPRECKVLRAELKREGDKDAVLPSDV